MLRYIVIQKFSDDPRIGISFVLLNPIEEPLMNDQTVRSMTTAQAIGLAGANANAIDPETSFEVAQYLLRQKRLLNDTYRDLSEKIKLIIYWEKMLKSMLRRDIDLGALEMPSHPNFFVSYNALIAPSHISFMDVIQAYTPRIEFRLTGSVWTEHWNYIKEHSGKHFFMRYAEPFFTSMYPQLMTTRLGEVWVSARARPLSQFPKTLLEEPKLASLGYITLMEYLLLILESYTVHAREGIKCNWEAPHHKKKVLCLGSSSYDKGTRKLLAPLISWNCGTMIIELEPREGLSGENNIVTIPVCRHPF